MIGFCPNNGQTEVLKNPNSTLTVLVFGLKKRYICNNKPGLEKPMSGQTTTILMT